MRMSHFDYSSEAFYFVTSCVKDRYHHFGEVVNQQMILNEYGKIAHNQWTWLYNQYSYIKSHAFVVMPNHIHGVIEIIHPEGNGRDRSQSGDSQSGDSQSGDSQSGDSQPGDSQSGDSQSGDSQSGDSQSGDSQSGDSQSGDSQPGDSQPGDSQSGDSQPGDSQSGDSQSGDSQSGDSQPGDSESGDSQSTKIKSLSELMGAYKTTSSKQIHLAGLISFLWQKSFYDNIIRDEQAFINIVNYIENNPKNWKEDKFY
jgi:putative transposase